MTSAYGNTTPEKKQKHNTVTPPATPADLTAQLAAHVLDLGVTLEVVRDLYEIAAQTFRDDKVDRRRASSLFVAIDRYMDDLENAHANIEELIEAAKGGAQ